MSLSATSFLSVQYEDLGGYWIKFYEQGTTTPKTMATDAAGGTLLAKAEISSGGTVSVGFIKTVGDAMLIPFVDGSYDCWAFPTEAEADANNTTNAVQLADDLTGGVNLGGDNEWTGDNNFVNLTVNNFTVFNEDNINEAVVPINPQTDTTYIFVIGDRGSVVTMSNANSNTITVPLFASVAYEVGTVLTVRQKGAGQTTIVAEVGVTIEIPVSKGLVIAEQGEWASLLNEAEDVWSLAGTTVA